MRIYYGYDEVKDYDQLKDTMLKQYNYSQKLQDAFDEIESMDIEDEVFDYIFTGYEEDGVNASEIYDILTIGFYEMVDTIAEW